MSDFSISTDAIDTLAFVSSRSQSPKLDFSEPPSLPAISDSGKKQAMTSPIGEEIGVQHPGISIDSFLPLLEALESPGLEYVDGKYYLRGAIPKEDFNKLADYARNVTNITLNDDLSSIDAATWIRLVQLGARYNKSDTLFPSLQTLRIDITKTHTPLSLLPLFLVPTLQSLDVIDFPSVHTSILITFLTGLVDEAPGLSTIRLHKPFDYVANLHRICMKFLNLRIFQISNVGIGPGCWKPLQDIGELPDLEVLVINAYRIYDMPSSSFPPMEDDEPRAPSVFYEQYKTKPSALCSPEAYSPRTCSPSPIPIFDRMPSPSPSIPGCMESPTYELNNLIANPVEESSVSSRFCKLSVLHLTGDVSLMFALVDLIKSPEIIELSMTLRRDENTWVGEAPDAKHFDVLWRKVLETWGHSLKNVTIGSLTQSPLDVSIFRPLLSKSDLHHLQIHGFTLTSDLGEELHRLTMSKVPSKLETLHLPIDLGGKGISLQRLHSIVESCPSLSSFQCGFKHLSNVPPCPEIGATYNLKTLRVGNPTAHTDHGRLREIAQYLDALFPNLETIETQEGCNAEQWKEIFELVQMCQFSRSHHLAQRA